MTDRPAGSINPLEVGMASVLMIEPISVDNEEVTTSSITGSVIGLSDCVTEPDGATVGSVSRVDNPGTSEDNSAAPEDSGKTFEVENSVSNVLLLLHSERIA
jgi:hypothetical protein